jgi:hypothetical protein
MASHYETLAPVTEHVSDRPPNKCFRPEANEYAGATSNLLERDRHIGDFLRACLAWVKADPDAALATLAPWWPEPRPRGKRSHHAGAQAGERLRAAPPH